MKSRSEKINLSVCKIFIFFALSAGKLFVCTTFRLNCLSFQDTVQL